MKLRSAAAVVVVLAVTTVLAQESSPASEPAPAPQTIQGPLPTRHWGKGAMVKNQAGPVTPPALEQSVQDLEGTVNKMRAVLKQMQGKNAANGKDPIAKANLEMWELLVDHLDKQLQELRQTAAARADMEVRRAAMYKQAEAKSQAAAQAARTALFSQQGPAAQGAQSPAVKAPAASQTSTPAPNTSSSPN
jgi:hypothetical protein